MADFWNFGEDDRTFQPSMFTAPATPRMAAPGEDIPVPGEPPPGGGGTLPGGQTPGSDYGAPSFEDYHGPMGPNFGFFTGAPRFSAPRFKAPSAEEARQEPGYDFRLGEGERALQQSAAGRGVLRTGGTLKDILAFGQNFAAQEYSSVFNRALQSYDRTLQASQAEFAPLLVDWQARMAAQQRAAELEFQRQWEKYALAQQLKNNLEVAAMG